MRVEFDWDIDSIYDPAGKPSGTVKHIRGKDILVIEVPLRRRWQWPDYLSPSVKRIYRDAGGNWFAVDNRDGVLRPAPLSGTIRDDLLPPNDGPSEYFRPR